MKIIYFLFIRQLFVHFYQNSFYILLIYILLILISMFGVSATIPSTSISVPASLDAQKLIDAIRDQTDGVPNHLVFVLDIVSVRFGGYFTP
jgi:hypothetical protein